MNKFRTTVILAVLVIAILVATVVPALARKVEGLGFKVRREP